MNDTSLRTDSTARGGGWRRLAVLAEYRALEAAFIALVAMNAINVFARYVLNRSIGSLFEVMILLSVAAYWLGIATAERSRSHLGMSFFVERLPDGARRVTAVVRLAVIVGFLLATAYSGSVLALGQFRSGVSSGTLGMPLWLFTSFIPLGSLLMLWRVLWPTPAGGAGAA